MNARPPYLPTISEFQQDGFRPYSLRQMALNGGGSPFSQIMTQDRQQQMLNQQYANRYGSMQSDGSWNMPMTQENMGLLSSYTPPTPPVGTDPNLPSDPDPTQYMQRQMNMPNYYQQITNMAGMPNLGAGNSINPYLNQGLLAQQNILSGMGI